MAKRRADPPGDTVGITDLDGYPGTPNADNSEPVKEDPPVVTKEAEKPTKEEKAVAPQPKPAVVTYRVFAAVSGLKADKLAGFQRYVVCEEMRPATVAEWRQRYADFLSRPVKSLTR